MMNKNKMKKEEFLALHTQKQLELVNSVLKNGKTEDISKKFDFSYSWLAERFKEKNIFFAGSIKRFIIEERMSSFTDNEILELKCLLKDYEKFKNEKSVDIRLCAGACGEKTVTKSIVIDKEINDKFNEFYKSNNFINAKDIYTTALKEFIEKYQ